MPDDGCTNLSTIVVFSPYNTTSGNLKISIRCNDCRAIYKNKNKKNEYNRKVKKKSEFTICRLVPM
jgi:hypothetical protein